MTNDQYQRWLEDHKAATQNTKQIAKLNAPTTKLNRAISRRNAITESRNAAIRVRNAKATAPILEQLDTAQELLVMARENLEGLRRKLARLQDDHTKNPTNDGENAINNVRQDIQSMTAHRRSLAAKIEKLQSQRRAATEKLLPKETPIPLPFSVSEKTAAYLKNEVKVGRELGRRTPAQWLSRINKIPQKALRHKVARVIWWDYFANHTRSGRCEEFNQFMAYDNDEVPLQELRLALCGCGYTPAMAAHRIKKIDYTPETQPA